MSKAPGQSGLSGQAGYPRGRFQGSFDPAMGRGYRGGDRVVIPAGEQRQLVNHGLVDAYFRWKISLYGEAVDGVSYNALTAYFLQVSVVGKNENDAIERNTLIGIGRGQVLYVPGRSLNVIAINPTDRDIAIHYSLDEATPGLSAWTTDEQISTAAETPLDIASFSTQLQVFSLTGGTNWRIRGYDAVGAVVYDEVLNAPRSAQVPVVPSLFYTIAPVAAGAHSCVVVYQCVG